MAASKVTATGRLESVVRGQRMRRVATGWGALPWGEGGVRGCGGVQFRVTNEVERFRLAVSRGLRGHAAAGGVRML